MLLFVNSKFLHVGSWTVPAGEDFKQFQTSRKGGAKIGGRRGPIVPVRFSGGPVQDAGLAA